MSTIVLNHIGWETYRRLLDDVGEQARLTYDRGCLEIEMSPLLRHEAPKRLLETVIEIVCEEREVPFLPLGSATIAREERGQGAEPDSGFVLGERAVIGEDYTAQDASQLPPDLVVEVDVTSPSVDKDALYHAIRVAEIWRWRDGALAILTRGEDGYVAAGTSALLRGVRAAQVTELVLQGLRTTQLDWRRVVRRWAAASQ